MNFSPSSTKSTSGCGADDPTPNVATALACDDTTDFLQTESMAIIATTSPEIKALNLHLRHHQHQPDNNINYNNYYGSSSRHPNKINLFPLSPPSGLVNATTEAGREGEYSRPILNLNLNDDDKENQFQKEKATEDVTGLFKKQTIFDDDDDDDDSLLSSSLNVLGLHDTNRSHLPPPPPSSSSDFYESSMTGMSIDLIGSPPSSTNDGMRRPKSDGHHTRVSSKRKPVHRRVSYDSLPSPKEIVENDNVIMTVVSPTFANTMDSLYDSNGNDLRSSTTMTTRNPLKTNNNNNNNNNHNNNTRALGRGDYSPHGHEGKPSAASSTRFSGSGPLFFPVDL